MHEGSWTYDGYTNLTSYRQDGVDILPPSVRYVGNRISLFSYDSNGNALGDGTLSFEWTGQNRLRSVSRAGSTLESYGYDGAGHRIVRDRDGRKRYFLRGPDGQVLSEYVDAPSCAAATTWAKDYVYLNGKMVAQLDRGIAAPGFVQAYGMDGQIRLLWTQVGTGDERYSIYRSEDGNRPAMPTYTDIACNPTSWPGLGTLCTFDDVGMTNGTTYHYWVATVTDCFESTPAGPTADAPSLPPEPPDVVRAARNRVVTGETELIAGDGGFLVPPPLAGTVAIGGATIEYAFPGASGDVAAPTVQAHELGVLAGDIATSVVEREVGYNQLSASYAIWSEADPFGVADCDTYVYVKNRGGSPVRVTPWVVDRGAAPVSLAPQTIDPDCGYSWRLSDREPPCSPCESTPECSLSTVFVRHDGDVPDDVVAWLAGAEPQPGGDRFAFPLELTGDALATGVVYTAGLVATEDAKTRITIRNDDALPVTVTPHYYIDGAPAEEIAPTLYVNWQPPTPTTGVTGYRIGRKEVGVPGAYEELTPAPVTEPWYADADGVTYERDYEYAVRAVRNHFNQSAWSTPDDERLPAMLTGEFEQFVPFFSFSPDSDTELRLRNTLDAGIDVQLHYLAQDGSVLGLCELTLPPNRSSMASARACLEPIVGPIAVGSVRIVYTGAPEALLAQGRWRRIGEGSFELPARTYVDPLGRQSRWDATQVRIGATANTDTYFYVQNPHADAAVEVTPSYCVTGDIGLQDRCTGTTVTLPPRASLGISMRADAGACMAGATQATVSLAVRWVDVNRLDTPTIVAVAAQAERQDIPFFPRLEDPIVLELPRVQMLAPQPTGSDASVVLALGGELVNAETASLIVRYRDGVEVQTTEVSLPLPDQTELELAASGGYTVELELATADGDTVASSPLSVCFELAEDGTGIRLGAESRPQAVHLAFSPVSSAGVHIERAPTEYGPWTRLTTEPLAGMEFIDSLQGTGLDLHADYAYRMVPMIGEQPGPSSLPVIGSGNVEGTALAWIPTLAE